MKTIKKRTPRRSNPNLASLASLFNPGWCQPCFLASRFCTQTRSGSTSKQGRTSAEILEALIAIPLLFFVICTHTQKSQAESGSKHKAKTAQRNQGTTDTLMVSDCAGGGAITFSTEPSTHVGSTLPSVPCCLVSLVSGRTLFD
jgi:hypothetical protein